MNLKKLMKKEGYDYKTSRDIYFNTIIHNNEKYLFFECKNINKIINKINFNLILYSDPDNLYEINNMNYTTCLFFLLREIF
jgi:hypothetical protein